MRFNSEGYYGRRVKVQGVVTEQKGNSLFIQFRGDGLYVKTYQTNALLPGDVVEVTGFPLAGQYSPLLEDALVRRVGEGIPPPARQRPHRTIGLRGLRGRTGAGARVC